MTEYEAMAAAICKADGNDWETMQKTYDGRLQCRCYHNQARDAWLASYLWNKDNHDV